MTLRERVAHEADRLERWAREDSDLAMVWHAQGRMDKYSYWTDRALLYRDRALSLRQILELDAAVTGVASTAPAEPLGRER